MMEDVQIAHATTVHVQIAIANIETAHITS